MMRCGMDAWENENEKIIEIFSFFFDERINRNVQADLIHILLQNFTSLATHKANLHVRGTWIDQCVVSLIYHTDAIYTTIHMKYNYMTHLDTSTELSKSAM